MKHYSELQVDAIIKIKFGKLVVDNKHTSYVSNAMLGRLFKCSASKIRQLYMSRFAEIKKKSRTLNEVLQEAPIEAEAK